MRVDRQTDRRDEADSRLSRFCECTKTRGESYWRSVVRVSDKCAMSLFNQSRDSVVDMASRLYAGRSRV
jgi:hypothetical protein